MAGSEGSRRAPAAFGTFSLLPIDTLRPHEEIDPTKIDELRLTIEEESAVLEPVLVARGSWVVLNGHHRVEALRRLGARLVPAWVVDYEDEAIIVDRWPRSSVEEVPDKATILARAQAGRLYPPKTSRHTVRRRLPKRKTPLAVLF